MTRLKRALVLASVTLFALALGIALGGGPLQSPVHSTLQSQVEAVTDGPGRAALVRRNHQLARASRYDSNFADAMSPRLLDGRLTDRPVALLALPGVPSRVSEAVAEDITTAGGSVTTTLRVGRDLVDPTARPLVDELSRRLLADLDDVDTEPDAPVYTRVGTVAARALLTTEDGGVALDEQARSVFSTFTTAHLLTGPEPQQRASAVVVLVPEPRRGARATSAGRGTVLTELAAAMDQAGDGVVVAGPTPAAEPRGLVSAVRSTDATADAVSTVDGVDSRAGQVVTALALAQQVDGTVGHYGTGRGADALMPQG